MTFRQNRMLNERADGRRWSEIPDLFGCSLPLKFGRFDVKPASAAVLLVTQAWMFYSG
jgi:hypothetical protein